MKSARFWQILPPPPDDVSIRGVARLFSQGGHVFSRGGQCLAKRDRARHAQRAERSGGLQAGSGGAAPSVVQGRSPGGGLGENFAKIKVF